MSKKIFITGTDTEVGKTYISCQLLKYFNNKNLSTVALKPIASGCDETLKNQDAVLLSQEASVKLEYAKINPFIFKEPIAPHIAAANEGKSLTVASVMKAIQEPLQSKADICIIEGAGGWYVPLNSKETYSDVVKTAELNVILVVGMKLGCINHALLSVKAILNDKVKLLGWIANCVDPKMQQLDENIATLRTMLPVPCLGVAGYGEDIDFAGI